MSGPGPSITFAFDGPNTAPAQGDVLYHNGMKCEPAAPAGG